MAATAPIRERALRVPDGNREARASMRAQIARLEQRLGLLAFELGASGRSLRLPAGNSPLSVRSARLLDLGELEAVRDGLVADVHAAGLALERCLESEAAGRARLERMLAQPRDHRFERVGRAELGEPGCGAYAVRPRMGLLGMMFGWWCVKLSSGCPLAMPSRYHYRRARERRSRNPTLELVAAAIVVVVVIAALITFLVVFHDFPLRVSGQ